MASIAKTIFNRGAAVLSAKRASVALLKSSSHQVRSIMFRQAADHYRTLDQGNNVLATYIWIDGSGEFLRSKTRTLDSQPASVADIPEWTFDGSSTGQAEGRNSDVYLVPVAMYPDPFSGKVDQLVLCETWNFDKTTPTKTNQRKACKEVLDKIDHLEPWFGMEQEFTFFDMTREPLGWPKHGYPGPQGPYYCGLGANKVYGREIVDSMYKAQLYAGLKVGGINAEVMPSQWEYQVGPVRGIEMGDQLWMARYIMQRVSEDFSVIASLHPKPYADWNGAGCHCNFSTKPMREEGGFEIIKAAMPKLEAKHHEHIKRYDPKEGGYNILRLTGLHETASIDKFTWGVADRGASVRIPRGVSDSGKGFLEDRRPSSNCDPYAVTMMLAKTICLDK